MHYMPYLVLYRAFVALPPIQKNIIRMDTACCRLTILSVLSMSGVLMKEPVVI